MSDERDLLKQAIMQLKNSTFLSLNIKDRWQNKTYMRHQTSVPNYPPFRTIFKKF